MDRTEAVLDVLDSREKAALLWMLALVVFATLKGGRSVVSSFRGVVRTFFQWKLQLVFGSAALYCLGVVLLAMWAGLWHLTAAKETVYWFCTGGVVLVGGALTHAKPFDWGFYKNLLAGGPAVHDPHRVPRQPVRLPVPVRTHPRARHPPVRRDTGGRSL
jgi:hypothetical protein